MPQPESETFQHYQVLRRPDGSLHELGRGAMGITYKAFDTNLRSYVALKVVNSLFLNSDTARARFLREARAAAALRHRNVASVYHLGNDDQSFFYAMEFVEGETVASLIERTGPLPLATALSIVLQVARALGAAHRQNLIHRDIKPANLMVTREDEDEGGDGGEEDSGASTMSDGEASALHVKVIDFGLARSSLDAAGSSSGPITMGGFVGTAQFASPEQLEEKEVDIRSDIYSLGITLWFLLAGRAPFTGSMFSLYSQHLTKEPPWEQLGDRVPPTVRDILARMLQKNPADRYQTPAALRRGLENGLATLTAGGAGAAGAANFRVHPTDSPSEATSTRAASSTGGSQTPPSEGDMDATMVAATMVPPPSAAPIPPAPPSSSSDTGPARPGAILAGRYRLEEFLGEGGAGRTFRAMDLGDGPGNERLVALKLAWPGPTSSTEVETRLEAAAARLRTAPHPALLAVENAGRHGELLFMVNEWVRGFTVLDLLRARGRLPAAEALSLLGPAAAAADHARGQELDSFELAPSGVFIHFPDAQDGPAARRFLQVPLRAWPSWLLKAPAIALPAHQHSSGSSVAGDGMTYVGEMTIVAAPPMAARTTAGPRSARETVALVARLAHELLDGAPPDPHALASGRYTTLPALNEAANDVLRLALLPGREDAPPHFAGAGAFREALARAAGLEGAIVGAGRNVPVLEAAATMAPAMSRVPVADGVTSAGATILRDSPTVSAAAAPPPSAVPEFAPASSPGTSAGGGSGSLPIPMARPGTSPWVWVSIAALVIGLGAVGGTFLLLRQPSKPVIIGGGGEVTPEPTVFPTAAPPDPRPSVAPTVPPAPTAPPLPSGPQTLRVPGAYANIPAAMEVARPGDTVLVGPGSYPGPITLKESVRLAGENADTCLIVGTENDESPALLRVENVRAGSVEKLGFRGAGSVGPLGAKQDGILISNSTVTITGCQVTTMSGSGIVAYDLGSRPTLRNNRSTLNGQHGITFERGAGGLAENNVLEGNEQCGIIVGDRGSTPELRKNECRDNRRHGINFLRGSGGLAENNLLERNTGSGIAVDGNDTVPTLRSNRILNNRSHGVGYARGAAGKAEENVVEGSTGNGIFVYGADTAPDLRGNKVLRNRLNGLAFEKGSAGNAEDNVLEGNEGCGIFIADPLTSPNVVNNTATKNRQFGMASKNAPQFVRFDPSNKLIGNTLGATTKQQ